MSKTRGDGRGWGPKWWSCRATTLPPAPAAQVLSPKVLSPCRLALSHAVSWAPLMQKQHPGRQEFTHITSPCPREPPGAAGCPSAPTRLILPFPKAGKENAFKETNGILFTARIHSFLCLIQEIISNGIEHHPGMMFSCCYTNAEAKSKHLSEVDAAAKVGCSCENQETSVR